jgi:hypothetical protein
MQELEEVYHRLHVSAVIAFSCKENLQAYVDFESTASDGMAINIPDVA